MFLKPGEYLIKKSTIQNAGKGAFTNIMLPQGIVLDYYKGKKVSAKKYEKIVNDKYSWELSSPKGPFYIDAHKKKNSNWLRYLNDPRDSRVNVEPYQYGGKLYYRTTRKIYPEEELFVSYGYEYF